MEVQPVTRQSGDTGQARHERYLPALAILVSTLVFLEILGNGFIADDYFHLYNSANGPLWKTLATPYGGHLLFAYNAIYLLLFKLFGLNSAAYFAVLLSAHGVCVYLIYSIIQRLTHQPHLAAFGATLWGMCPINAGSLGFISVLGHIFATAAILAVVLELTNLERTARPPRPAVIIRIYCLLLAAASSFGVGLAVAMGFPAIFFLWNPTPELRKRISLIFVSIVVLLPLVYFGTSQQQPADYLAGMPQVPLTLLRLVLVGCGSLLGGPLLIGDAVPLPSTWILPTAITLGGLGSTVIALAWLRASSPMRGRILALGASIACCYGVIAVARWAFMAGSTPILRYHYMGTAIFSILICLSLSTLLARVEWLQRNGPLLYFGWLLVLIIPYSMATTQADEGRYLIVRNQHHRALVSLPAQLSLAIKLQLGVSKDGESPVYLQNERFNTGSIFPAEEEFPYFPGLAGFFIISYPDNSYRGRSVRFISEDEEKVAMARDQAGSRISQLLVSAEEWHQLKRTRRRNRKDQRANDRAHVSPPHTPSPEKSPK